MTVKDTSFKLSKLALVIFAIISVNQSLAVDFNTDILDAEDKKNIDITRFSNKDYIMPGQYQMQVMVNGQNISPSDFMISIAEFAWDNDVAEKKKPIAQVCLTREIINKIGLTATALEKLTFRNDGQCADFRALPGVGIHPNVAEGILHINMPQAWMEYSDESWLPPSRWDDGVPGLLFDYNINGNVNKPKRGRESQYVSYNGTAGANIGAWRFRGDYQGNLSHASGAGSGERSRFDWSRLYFYRAIPRLQSKLTVGENYTNSEIFSTWQYTGASLESDERMLPPKLRGYAPQVSGVADTNARVVISQQGRIIYDSTVPAGPFTIQDLDSSIRGRLDVEVTEQNGQKKTFHVETANLPYLTRPGQIRYKLVSGRSRTWGHSTEGPVFVGGEMSWGVSNFWSLYGGGILAGNYNALALGVGRDLMQFGTLSADVTQSAAMFSNKGIQQGKSWRLSYSKRFEDVDTDITFAGYRFSERKYMTMQQYLDARYRGNFDEKEKELYTVSVNKNLRDLQASIGLQYQHQTYWNRGGADYYTVSFNHYFDMFGLQNISAGLAASRSKYMNRYNDSVFLRLSVPVGGAGSGRVSYGGSMANNRYVQTVGYSDTLNHGLDNYSVNMGLEHGNGERSQGQMSSYYSHNSPVANFTANFSSAQNRYTSYGLSASGGATFTAKGAALHSGGMNGGTRLLVDTDGISGVPVDGGRVLTNRWGIGVVTDLGSYYRNTTSVDLNNLPDDMEATRSVVESTLTEGAIGYRKFGILKGSKLFAVLRLSDGSHPPFGASVTNAIGRELGMVAENGLTWLSGVNKGETLKVNWDSKMQCVVDIPEILNPEQQLLLPCRLQSHE